MVAWMMLAVIDNAVSSATVFLFIDMTCGAIPVIRMPVARYDYSPSLQGLVGSVPFGRTSWFRSLWQD
jgi:hypothetical protein